VTSGQFNCIDKCVFSVGTNVEAAMFPFDDEFLAIYFLKNCKVGAFPLTVLKNE